MCLLKLEKKIPYLKLFFVSVVGLVELPAALQVLNMGEKVLQDGLEGDPVATLGGGPPIGVRGAPLPRRRRGLLFLLHLCLGGVTPKLSDSFHQRLQH